MDWIFKKPSDLEVGDKFVLNDPDMFFWHRYNTVVAIDGNDVLCEDFSRNGTLKFTLKRDDTGSACIIRPDAPLHLRKECYAMANDYLHWPYDYPDKQIVEAEIRKAIEAVK